MRLLCLCLDCWASPAKDCGGNGCFKTCLWLVALVKPSHTRSDGPWRLFAEKPLYPTQSCVGAVFLLGGPLWV